MLPLSLCLLLCVISCEGLNPGLEGFSFPVVGQCQGIRLIGDNLYIFGETLSDRYGDVRKVAFIQELDLRCRPTGWQGIFAKSGWKAVITHPNGIAWHPGLPCFVSINEIIYQINWDVFRKNGNLDGALIRTVKDTESRDGTRIEYVQIAGKWYVATCDYHAAGGNEIRIMDPWRLAACDTTGDPGVVVYRFPAASRIQSLYWNQETDRLVLVGNVALYRGWKLVCLDLEKAVETGSGTDDAVVAARWFPYVSELEGYSVLPDGSEVFVTSSPRKNLFISKDRGSLFGN